MSLTTLVELAVCVLSYCAFRINYDFFLCKIGFSPSIRLCYGSYGRVEVYHPSYGWGTVCDDYWDITDAGVLCRQLGYNGASAAYQSAHYGQGSGQILLDNLHCTGSESYLWDCPRNSWASHDCSHPEDASVDCY